MAKNYSDNLSEEVRKGMAEKAEQGLYPSMAPLAYINVTVNGKKVMEVDPVRGPIIRKLFELYATGQSSLTALAKKAKELGLRHRKSGNPLSRSYMEYLLKNPIYLGEIHWNGKVYQGVHTPLVSRELFQAAQAALHRLNKPRYRKHEFAYVGLLTCGHCGCSITAEIKKNRYIYYHCSKGKGKCPSTYLREEELDAKLAELVRPLTLTPEIYDWVKQALLESHKEEQAFHESMTGQLRERHDLLQKKMEQAYEDKLEGKISEELWNQKSKEWQEEQNSVTEQMERCQNANRSYLDLGGKLIELAEKAPLLYSKQLPMERRKLLNILLSNCTLKGGILYPTYRKPFDILLQMPENKSWLRR